MNYLNFRRNRPPKKKEKFTLWKILLEIKATIQLIYGLLVGVPLLVLQQLGVNVIPSFFSFNIPLCSLCICGAVLGVTSSVGIGLGVGLGVGLSCAKTDNIISNATNRTGFNITN